MHAFLLDLGIEPTRNHKKKLDLFIANCGAILKSCNLHEKKLEDYYKIWLKIRYSHKKEILPKETVDFINNSRRLIKSIQNQIALRNKIEESGLENEIYEKILGGRWLTFGKECGIIHEKWQQELEVAGEMGRGSRLGNKLANPSNFSDVFASADDEVTRKILAEDEAIGVRIAKLYDFFLYLIDSMIIKRKEQGAKDNELTNFFLSINFRYHGITVDEIVNQFLGAIFKNRDEENSEN